MEQKLQPLHELIAHLDSIEDDGYVLVFTDGSSEQFKGVAFIGDDGRSSKHPVEVSETVPLNMKHTTHQQRQSPKGSTFTFAELTFIMSHPPPPPPLYHADTLCSHSAEDTGHPLAAHWHR